MSLGSILIKTNIDSGCKQRVVPYLTHRFQRSCSLPISIQFLHTLRRMFPVSTNATNVAPRILGHTGLVAGTVRYEHSAGSERSTECLETVFNPNARTATDPARCRLQQLHGQWRIKELLLLIVLFIRFLFFVVVWHCWCVFCVLLVGCFKTKP